MKIVTILGARPNFIKAYLISQELKKRHHQEIIIHTGQHYDFVMSEIFFKDLNIPKPHYNLGLKSDQINLMIDKISHLLKKTKPNLVLIYGDTNSSLCGTIASFINQIPVAHVEAGPRCFDMEMPEERNRIIIDHYSHWLFAPTISSYNYLKREGKNHVYFTGNVMYDSLKQSLNIIKKNHILTNLKIEKPFCLLTLHRPQNVDSELHLKTILQVIQSLPVKVIFPIHPRTKSRLLKFKLYKQFGSSCRLIQPVGYLDMLTLIFLSEYVITDSGGVQTEAYNLKRPCITLLNKSAWNELVENGWNRIAKMEKKDILNTVVSFQKKTPLPGNNVFGNGNSYIKIINILEKAYGKK
jgi:UDP-N-acetylglucosamine 2-epimerase